MAGTGRRFFFQNCTLPVSYPCPSRVHRYDGHGYVGIFLMFLFFLSVFCFFFGGYGYWFDVNRGEFFWNLNFTGRRVNGYNGFFPKKRWLALLKPVPVYPFTCLYPGTGTAGTRHGYRWYQAWVHGYGLYPAGFSKPLNGLIPNESRASHKPQFFLPVLIVKKKCTTVYITQPISYFLFKTNLKTG
jgi:hypothetical protein